MAIYLRGLFTAALGGAGGAVIAMNLHSGSPRLMTAGVTSAIIGMLGGAIGLAGDRQDLCVIWSINAATSL
jgi:hypothetical protein